MYIETDTKPFGCRLKVRPFTSSLSVMTIEVEVNKPTEAKGGYCTFFFNGTPLATQMKMADAKLWQAAFAEITVKAREVLNGYRPVKKVAPVKKAAKKKR